MAIDTLHIMIQTLRTALLKLITTYTHKTTRKERMYLYIHTIVVVLSLLCILFIFRAKFFVHVPASGGMYTDAIVGIPRFVNPVLAQSEADKTLTALVYSGLMREVDQHTYIPDLAKEYKVSPDELTYTFTLRPDLTFHDGSPITAKDIEYTVHQIQKNITPATAGWQGVTVKQIDNITVEFTLRKKFADFLRMTTIGILPSHVWEPLSEESFSTTNLNTRPVGSGPYRVSDLKVNSSGITEMYTLKRFNDSALGRPYIKKLFLYTVSHTDNIIELLEKGLIDGTTLRTDISVHDKIKNITGYKKSYTPSTKVFGLFFNKDRGIASDTVVKEYIAQSIDSLKIIDQISGETGFLPAGPVPQSMAEKPVLKKIDLEKNGWSKNTTTGIYEKRSTGQKLTLTITTLDNPELKILTELIVRQLSEAGIEATPKVFQVQDLERAILAERDFEAFLFGYTITTPSDLYAFWHSSQRTYPGLNITQYQNSKVDLLLEKLIQTSDNTERQKITNQIVALIAQDIPAIFIYNPADVTFFHKDIYLHNQKTTILSETYHRFYNINKWYMYTDMIWKIFEQK